MIRLVSYPRFKIFFPQDSEVYYKNVKYRVDYCNEDKIIIVNDVDNSQIIFDLNNMDVFAKNYIENFSHSDNLKNKKNQFSEANDILDKEIEFLGISNRCIKSLHNENAYTVGDILKYDKNYLLGIDNFGKTSFNELISALKVYGLEISD